MGPYLLGLLTGFVLAALVIFGIGELNDPKWIAAFIALGALFLGVLDRKEARDDRKARERAHVVLVVHQHTDTGIRHTFVRLRNQGPGIGHVKDIVFQFDGTQVSATTAAWFQSVRARNPALPVVTQQVAGFSWDGVYLSPQQEIPLLAMTEGEAVLDRVKVVVDMYALSGEHMPDHWTFTYTGPAPSTEPTQMTLAVN